MNGLEKYWSEAYETDTLSVMAGFSHPPQALKHSVKPCITHQAVWWGQKCTGFGQALFLMCIFQVALMVKNLPAKAGDLKDMGSIPGLGRYPGERHGNPLQ